MLIIFVYDALRFDSLVASPLIFKYIQDLILINDLKSDPMVIRITTKSLAI